MGCTLSAKTAKFVPLENLYKCGIISTARYIEDVWIQKCVIFANAFPIANFTKLKDS